LRQACVQLSRTLRLVPLGAALPLIEVLRPEKHLVCGVAVVRLFSGKLGLVFNQYGSNWADDLLDI
jgi:hypothetical protein